MDHNRVSSAKQITFNSLCIRSFWSSVAFSETIASCCAPSTQIFHTSWVHKLPAHVSLARNLPVCRFELWLELSFLLFMDLKDHSNDFSCLRVRYPHGLWVIISPHMLRFPDLMFTVCEPPQYFHTVTPVFPAWLCSGLPEIAGHESTAPLPNGNCATTNSGTFHKRKYEKSVDFSGTTTRSGSSQHVSMRGVSCKVSKVLWDDAWLEMCGCPWVHKCPRMCMTTQRQKGLKTVKIKTIKRSPGHVSVRNHNWVTSLITNHWNRCCSKCCSAFPSHSPNVSFALICSSQDFDVLKLNQITLIQCGASSQERHV